MTLSAVLRITAFVDVYLSYILRIIQSLFSYTLQTMNARTNALKYHCCSNGILSGLYTGFRVWGGVE